MTHSKTFIASSLEHIEIARAVQSNLAKYDITTTIWDQGVFPPGKTFLSSIIEEINECDFAIVILSADDKLLIKDGELETRKNSPLSKLIPRDNFVFQSAPRDNVVFEMGICVGILGFERTFYIFDRSIKKPTDISGITGEPYTFSTDKNRLTEKDLRSLYGPASTTIANIIKKLGYRFKNGDRIDKYKTSVDIYYFGKAFTKETAEQIGAELSGLHIDSKIYSHDNKLVPDAVFIGACVNADCARKVLGLIPYQIKYLFRPDYPDVDGGDSRGHKIGIGYCSKYNSESSNEKSKPVKLTAAQLTNLKNPRLSNTEFQLYLFKITGVLNQV